ncbi:hypothetical protein BSKO_00337 [Bryopsis sp. KO-2023]|nr:hypothetical protein BSKO_00337 [Bryopsis sp. KO-2023]
MTANTSQEPQSTGTIVTPAFAFGVNPYVKNPLVHGRDRLIYYSAGAFVVSYDVYSQEMCFLPTHEHVSKITAIAMAPNRKYLASAEVQGGNHQVSVFNLLHEKRVRTLSLDKSVAAGSAIHDMSFSDCAKLLVMQCGEPAWYCLCWRWYSGKIVASIKIEMRMIHITFNPWDKTCITCLSEEHMKTLHTDIDNETFKQTATVHQEEGRKWTCFAWLDGGLLALCNDHGEIAIYHSGVVKDKFSAGLPSEEQIRTIQKKGHGFVIGGSLGTLAGYEASDARRKGNMYSQSWSWDVVPARSDVLKISVSQSEEELVLVTANYEIIVLEIDSVSNVMDTKAKVADVLEADEVDSPSTILCGGFNSGEITGMDICNKMPLLVTCSANRLFTMWNYMTRECVLRKHLLDDPLSVSLHPSGVQVLIGMHNKLRLFLVLHNDLQALAELPVKKCTMARFSDGGHIFAAVGRANAIVIFDSYTHQQLAMMKGHVSTVTGFRWANKDRYLVSVGAGGACYTWDMGSFSRDSDREYVDKKNTYHSLAVTTKEIGAVIRTYDGKIQHIKNGVVEHEIQVVKGEFLSVELVAENNVLLIADSEGFVHSRPWPISFPVDNTDQYKHEGEKYKLHASQISHMAVSGDGNVLITASKNGVVLFSNMTHIVNGFTKNYQLAAEVGTLVLIDPAEIAGYRARMKDLALQISSAKTEAEYNTIRETQSLRDQINKGNSDHSKICDELAVKTKKLEELEASAQKDRVEAAMQMEVAHLAAAEELEDLYEKRLKLEIEKIKRVQASKDDMQFALEEKMRKVVEEQEEDKERIEQCFQDRLDMEDGKLDDLRKEKSEMERFFNEVLIQTEVDLEDYSDKMAEKIVQNDIQAKDRESKLKALRKKVQELEKHKYVLGHKAKNYQEALEPKAEQIRDLSDRMKLQDEKFVAEMEQARDLHRMVVEKDSFIKSLKFEIIDLKEQIAVREHKLKNISYDLVSVMGKPDERVRGKKSARQVALHDFVRKYSRNEAPPSADKSGDDLKRHLWLAECRNQTLEQAVKNREKKSLLAARERLHENVLLIRQIGEARKENKKLNTDFFNISREFTAVQQQLQATVKEERGDDHFSAREPPENTIIDAYSSGDECGPGTVSLAKASISRPSSGTSLQPIYEEYHRSTPQRAQSAGVRRSAPHTGARRATSAVAKKGTMYGISQWRNPRPSSASEKVSPKRQFGPSHSDIKRIASQLAANSEILEHQNAQISNLQALIAGEWEDAGEAEEELLYREEDDLKDDLDTPGSELAHPSPPSPATRTRPFSASVKRSSGDGGGTSNRPGSARASR